MLRWIVLISVGLLAGCGSATVPGDDPKFQAYNRVAVM